MPEIHHKMFLQNGGYLISVLECYTVHWTPVHFTNMV